jgi:hypothetical protein
MMTTLVMLMTTGVYPAPPLLPRSDAVFDSTPEAAAGVGAEEPRLGAARLLKGAAIVGYAGAGILGTLSVMSAAHDWLSTWPGGDRASWLDSSGFFIGALVSLGVAVGLHLTAALLSAPPSG